ncbi:MAG TPA: hypothetical protein VD932_01100 [Aquabacterium sp.]|nr:hypothetical protein [Aquabacterium sp.]
MLVEKKQSFASRMGLSPGRLSQMVAAGMPVREDGLIDVLDASAWIRDTVDIRNGRATVERAREVAVHGMVAKAAGYAVHEAPIWAAIAAAEAGVPRAQAERLADVLVVLLAKAVEEELTRAGVPNVEQAFKVPHPDAWRRNVNWPGIYDTAGTSLCAGDGPSH